MNFQLLTPGYVDGDDGYTKAFTWWRNHTDRRVFSVVAYLDEFGFDVHCKAVIDDFGNLRKVAA